MPWLAPSLYYRGWALAKEGASATSATGGWSPFPMLDRMTSPFTRPVRALIAKDLGGAAPVNIIPDLNDRQRANFIPFRGKPSDVKFVQVNGQTKLYARPAHSDVPCCRLAVSTHRASATTAERSVIGGGPLLRPAPDSVARNVRMRADQWYRTFRLPLAFGPSWLGMR